MVLLLFLFQLGLYLYRHFSPQPLEPRVSEQVPLPTVMQESSVGINANEIHYEDASIPFIDLFRVSSPFAENVLGLHSGDVTYDANGWPTDLHGGEAGTKFLGKIPAEALPQGEYTVLYDGEGKLRYGHDVKVVSQTTGRETITINAGDDGLLDASVVITQTNPANYLRNIRILPPGGICQRNPLKWVMQASECTANDGQYLAFVQYYSSIVFNPDYLNFMKDFSTIRFMGMSGITRNPVEHWQARPHPEQANWGGTYGARGVPVEVMVDLANRLHKDAWFNLPHAADDDYVRQFATYVRDHLRPELKVYVEYTNEAWNTTFSHSEYVQKKGIELGLGENNAVEAGYQYYTIRARQVFQLWEQVFGGHERFVRVLGGWDTRPDITQKLLSYDNTYQQVDAVAIAPYFGGNVKGFRESSSVEDIFRLTTAEDSYRSLPEVLKMVRKQAELAHQFGVDLIGYEGGQGLVDWVTRQADQHPNPLFFAANRDPRMGELYTQFLQGWGDAGGKLLMLFSAPRTCQWYGCWGLKEDIRQPREQAYKYDAVLKFLAERKQWWGQQAQDKPAQNPTGAAKPRNPNDPVIVWRPATEPDRFFFLENPRTLDMLLETRDWAKKDSFGKWQGKWDEDYLYLTVRVYDEKIVQDSPDPTDDDSVELLLDADNSRGEQMDGKNDFRLVFSCKRGVTLGEGSAFVAPEWLAQINTDMRTTADGYVLEAWIPWQVFGIKPQVKDRVAAEVEINDDDDGGTRDKKIGWVAANNQAVREPKQWGVILFSGR